MPWGPFGKKKEVRPVEKEITPVEVEEEPSLLEKLCGGDMELYGDLAGLLPSNPLTGFKIPGNDNPSPVDIRNYAVELKNEGNTLRARVYFDMAIAKTLWQGIITDVQKIYEETEDLESRREYNGVMRDIGKAQKITNQFYTRRLEEIREEAQKKRKSF